MLFLNMSNFLCLYDMKFGEDLQTCKSSKFRNNFNDVIVDGVSFHNI